MEMKKKIIISPLKRTSSCMQISNESSNILVQKGSLNNQTQKISDKLAWVNMDDEDIYLSRICKRNSIISKDFLDIPVVKKRRRSQEITNDYKFSFFKNKNYQGLFKKIWV